jgi:hypothetical protein
MMKTTPRPRQKPRLRLPLRLTRRPFRKPPSDRALLHILPVLEERVSRLIEPLSPDGNFSFTTPGQYGVADLGNFVAIRNDRLLKPSTTNAILDLGIFRSGLRTVRLVGRLARFEEKLLGTLPREKIKPGYIYAFAPTGLNS